VRSSILDLVQCFSLLSLYLPCTCTLVVCYTQNNHETKLTHQAPASLKHQAYLLLHTTSSAAQTQNLVLETGKGASDIFSSLEIELGCKLIESLGISSLFTCSRVWFSTCNRVFLKNNAELSVLCLCSIQEKE